MDKGTGGQVDGWTSGVQSCNKQFFFVNSENLGIRIWQKNCVNYNKFEIAEYCANHIFNQSAFFLPFDRCYMILSGYLHSIYIIFIIYRLGKR